MPGGSDATLFREEQRLPPAALNSSLGRSQISQASDRPLRDLETPEPKTVRDVIPDAHPCFANSRPDPQVPNNDEKQLVSGCS